MSSNLSSYELIAAQNTIDIETRLQEHPTRFNLADIRSLHQHFPALLHNKTNMELALMLAIEAEDLDFVQQLLDICVEYSQDCEQPLRIFYFGPILEKVLTKNNPTLISMVFRCPHEFLGYTASRWDNLRTKLQEEMVASLDESDASVKYAKWWVYQLKHVISLDVHHKKISDENIIRIILTKEVQDCLTKEEWLNSIHLLSLTRNPDILSALLENPRIFSHALSFYRSVLNHSHQNWESRLINDADIMTALDNKIKEKIANPNEAELKSYTEILYYYLTIPQLHKAEIDSLLNVPWIFEEVSHSLYLYSDEIYSGHLHYPELLKHQGFLTHFLDLGFEQMKNELTALALDTQFIDQFKIQYQSKESAQEIWVYLQSNLPELKKHLIKLDQSLNITAELKQMFKNLLHLVKVIITLGYHYYQRRRDYGQCFFKSASIENQVKIQTEHLMMSQNFSLN